MTIFRKIKTDQILDIIKSKLKHLEIDFTEIYVEDEGEKEKISSPKDSIYSYSFQEYLSYLNSLKIQIR